MNRAHVRLVLARELLDYRRQRKVWRRLFLQPFLIVLLLGVPVLFFRAADEREKKQEFSVAVEGDASAVPGLQAALNRRPLSSHASTDAERDVVSRVRDVAVVVPPDAAAAVAAGLPVPLQLLALPVDASSRFGGEAVQARLAELRTSVASRALATEGLPAEVAAPFAFEVVDLNQATGEGTRLGLAQALPALLAIQLFGLMASAEERLAGAKDRRVLEPLLVLPFRRLDILLGIGGATMSAGFIAAALLFVPMVVGLTLAVAAVSSTVAGPAEVAGALLFGVLLFGIVFTAIGLFAGARAHTGGEGSVFVTVAQVGVFALVSATPFLTDVAAKGPILLVPILGPMLLVRDVVASGFSVEPTMTALLGAAAVTMLLVRAAVRQLDTEGSVLRSAR
jgi:ABC-type Na+ efflux pump permease subunit